MNLAQKDISNEDNSERNSQSQQGADSHFTPNWVVHLQPNGGLLVEKNSKFYLRISGLALKLALQLTRSKCFTSTVTARSILDKQPREEVKEELLNALNLHPFTASWLHGSLGSHLPISGSSESYLPLTATLQLTNSCNLNCSFCYASSGEALKDELNPAQWIHLLEKLSIGGLMSVTLSGGEPTIARGFPQILEAASALINTVDIFTNGLVWPNKYIDLVTALGNVRCQVSIDGLENNHDILRGRERSFELALSTINRLSDAGVYVIAAMTVTPENYRDLEKLIYKLDSAGAKEFRAGRAVAEGRNKNNDAALSESHIQHVVQQFNNFNGVKLKGISLKVWDACDSGISREFTQTDLPVEFMTPAYINWYIRADGWVTPCQVEELKMGNAITQSLAELGRPDKLANICITGRGCRCLSKVRVPTEVDLPF